MNKLLALALIAASLTSFPVASTAFAAETGAAANNPLCAPDAPEGYKRPGGYCDKINSTERLIQQDDCNYLVSAMKMDEVILVADNCYYGAS